MGWWAAAIAKLEKSRKGLSAPGYDFPFHLLSGLQQYQQHQQLQQPQQCESPDSESLHHGTVRSQGGLDMSLSPKHTPFSVTDILSPIDSPECYRKTTIEATIPPLTPYRNAQHPQSMGAMGGMSGMGVSVSNPYGNYVAPLSHHTAASFSAQYCNGSDLAGYPDPSRHSTSWYGSNHDTRFCE